MGSITATSAHAPRCLECPVVTQARLSILDPGVSSVMDLFGAEGGCPQQTLGRLLMVDAPQGKVPEGSSDERWNALEELDGWLRTPMLVLSFLWLLLVVVELVWGTFDALETFDTAIWIAFLLEFAIRLALAPEKAAFLSRNWLTIIALVVPAFRLFRAFRILRVTRAARSLRLVRIVGTSGKAMLAGSWFGSVSPYLGRTEAGTRSVG